MQLLFWGEGLQDMASWRSLLTRRHSRNLSESRTRATQCYPVPMQLCTHYPSCNHPQFAAPSLKQPLFALRLPSLALRPPFVSINRRPRHPNRHRRLCARRRFQADGAQLLDWKKIGHGTRKTLTQAPEENVTAPAEDEYASLLTSVQLTNTSSAVPELMARSEKESPHDETVTIVETSVRRAEVPRRTRWGISHVFPLLVIRPLVG